MKEKIKIIDAQFIVSFGFILTIIISIIINYDVKQKLLNKKRIFNDNQKRYVNLINRIIFTLVVIYSLYISYLQYEIKKESNPDPYIHQIYANWLNVIASLIILYIIYETWDEEGLSNTQNLI